jgi:3-oxoacyl-[acyl-carrier protein] reductase
VLAACPDPDILVNNHGPRPGKLEVLDEADFSRRSTPTC